MSISDLILNFQLRGFSKEFKEFVERAREYLEPPKLIDKIIAEEFNLIGIYLFLTRQHSYLTRIIEEYEESINQKDSIGIRIINYPIVTSKEFREEIKHTENAKYPNSIEPRILTKPEPGIEPEVRIEPITKDHLKEQYPIIYDLINNPMSPWDKKIILFKKEYPNNSFRSVLYGINDLDENYQNYRVLMADLDGKKNSLESCILDKSNNKIKEKIKMNWPNKDYH